MNHRKMTGWIGAGLLAATCAAAPVGVRPETMREGTVTGSDGRRGLVTGKVEAAEGLDGGCGFLLKGPDARIELPYPGNPETVAFEAWVRLPEKAVFRHIARRRGKNNQWQLFAAPAGNGEYLLYGMTWKKSDGKENFVGRSSVRLQGGRLHHVAMELDGASYGKLFIDGQEVCSEVPPDALRSGSSPLTLGGGKAGEAGDLFLQDPVIYDSKLPENWQRRVREQLYPWEKKFTPAEVMNFSAPGAWLTAPVELLDSMPEGEMWSAKSRFGNDPGKRIEAKTMRELATGARPEAGGMRWNRHPMYPTLHAAQVPADWSRQPAVSLKLASKEATGETVWLAFSADSKQTPYRDFYRFPFAVNFTGEKTITVSRDKFETVGEPAGWDKVDGAWFFTKVAGAQPHPATDLTLKELRPAAEPDNSAEFPGEIRQEKDADGFVFKMNKREYQRAYLNHPYPETRGEQPVHAPYAHQYYQAAERALFDYCPDFLPGFVSYGPDGRGYIHSGDLVQFRGEDGKWQYTDLVPILKQWAKEQGWPGLQLSWGQSLGEKAIRYDNDGDFYLLVPVEKLDADGKNVDWHTRTTLLLHSRDRMRSFEVHRLPGRLATFEKLDGHNRDCLKRPPVILLGDYSYFRDADPAGYLLTPSKKADGSLDLGKPVKYAEFAIPPDQHSGGGNLAITRGDKVFIVFGVASVNAIAMQDVKGAKQTVMPPIPPDHPGLKLSYQQQRSGKTFTEYSKNGTPTFIIEYDLKTGRLGEPRYLLSGGAHDDGHNWPAITADSRGILHVIANGHHNPVAYTHSLEPDNPYGPWSAPEYVKPGKSTPFLSYATLNCDKNDTLYTIHRSTTDVYNNHLGLYVKPAGQPWQGEEVLVTPYRYMYKVWGHKAIYNPATGGITLGFYSHSSMKQLMLDQYWFDIFQYPDEEKAYRGGKSDIGLPEGNKCKMYVGPAAELTLLTFDPDTKQWKLTVGKDLK
ncbi:LamG-like jellyroll fold domain-containing protein [Victivallis vadensis]|uniref:LamG-like jellyroll fold domain-containing protein n=1 Tax=Victivallis vadensis TaxID=172901 RepID=UPI0026DC7524|nr:LamG-like jellyroll fold domain-containing protein [Victivallis vadensis]